MCVDHGEATNPLPAKEMVMKKSIKPTIKADANRKKTPPTENKTTVAAKTEKSGPRVKLSAVDLVLLIASCFLFPR
jgi:hypothetical protein